ncbi:MAG: phosphate ABC transporter permease subunit PstC [Sedimentisphaerales bacterium]|nr:phosphate ABC transporter permease subunit PstC [Sedimentisphaerales bacterium]
MANQTPQSTKVADFDRPLLLTPGQDWGNYLINILGQALLFLITSLSVVAVLLIFFFIIRKALPFFLKHGVMEFFTSTAWYPEGSPAEFGAGTLMAGSLYVTVGALLFAVPGGILAAVFLSDILPFKARQIVKPIIEILAAIPSVAYGFFAIIVVAPWLQKHLGLVTGTNIFNASLILAVMAVPTIISVAEDALTAAGRELREASLALGATRAETIIKVMLPAAHSGIIAAIILGMMRAIGETMVVWMAAGNASQIPTPWWNIFASVRTMTATIAGDMAESPEGSDHRLALFAVGLTLLAFTFLLNLASEHFLGRSRGGGKGRKK